MPFIKSCTGQFKNTNDQIFFDITKEKTELTQGLLSNLLLTNVRSKLNETDPHYSLFQRMLDRNLANIAINDQIVLPMSIDFYEYALKLQTSKKEHMKKQRKAFLPHGINHSIDPFWYIFKHLNGALFASLFLLDDEQFIENSYKHFCNFSNEEFAKLLKEQHHVVDQNLLDGFIACREKYGALLSLAREAEISYDQLIEKTDPSEAKIFIERWSKILTLINNDMFEIKKMEIQAKESPLLGLGMFAMDEKATQLDQQLDQLFDYDLYLSKQTVSSPK